MSDKDKSIKNKTLSDYQRNPHNHNEGSERGGQMLERSFNQYGAGRSLLADKNGKLIAGNQSLQAAVDAGLVDVIEVETNGSQVVVVKRSDLDLEHETDTSAVELSYMDNRAHEVSFRLDEQQLAQDVNRGVDFSSMYTPAELQAHLPDAAHADTGRGEAQDVPEQYVLIIELASEKQLAELFEELESRGLSCRTLLS